MERIIVAFRAFFRVLFQSGVAERVAEVLDVPQLEAPAPTPRLPKPVERPGPPVRSEALTLLAALQREARFVDLVKEPLDSYSDAQIGAAARNVLRDCGAALDRMFALEPVLQAAEGSEVEVPAGYEPERYRLTGSVTGEPPYRGTLVHPGWQATRCELPRWTGSAAASLIVAAVEVEVK